MMEEEDGSGSSLVDVFVDRFSREKPPVGEIEGFYSLERVSVPEDRPYTWSNTITTLDGICSLGSGMEGVLKVGLRDVQNTYGGTDYKLLASGWAMADAVLFGGKSIRSEVEQKLMVVHKDLIAWRTGKLGYGTQQPLAIILTASGELDLTFPIFSTDRPKFVATSQNGYNTLTKIFSKIHPEIPVQEFENFLMTRYQTAIKVFKDHSNFINLNSFLSYIRSQLGVRFLDVSAGPSIINQFIVNKLIDECRYTTSGILAGKNSHGTENGIHANAHERVEQYPKDLDFPPNKWPILEFCAIRVYGRYHVYHRGIWKYRH